jgi:hypothetical protein
MSTPETLPADFFMRQGEATPDTLPADFFSKGEPMAPSPATPTAEKENQLLLGLKQSIPNFKTALGGTLEMVGKMVRDPLMASSGEELRRRATIEGDEYRPTVTDVREAVKSPEAFKDWFTYNLGTNGPNFLASGTAGLVGGPLASTGVSWILNAGSHYADLREQGVDKPAAAALAGIPMAILDSVVPMKLAGKLLWKPAEELVKQGLLKRTVKGFLLGAAEEGATETGQEAIAIGSESLHTGKPLLSDQNLARLLNAAAAGAAIGGFASGAVETIPARKSTQPQPQTQIEQTPPTGPVFQPAIPEPKQDLGGLLQTKGIPTEPITTADETWWQQQPPTHPEIEEQYRQLWEQVDQRYQPGSMGGPSVVGGPVAPPPVSNPTTAPATPVIDQVTPESGPPAEIMDPEPPRPPVEVATETLQGPIPVRTDWFNRENFQSDEEYFGTLGGLLSQPAIHRWWQENHPEVLDEWRKRGEPGKLPEAPSPVPTEPLGPFVVQELQTETGSSFNLTNDQGQTVATGFDSSEDAATMGRFLRATMPEETVYGWPTQPETTLPIEISRDARTWDLKDGQQVHLINEAGFSELELADIQSDTDVKNLTSTLVRVGQKLIATLNTTFKQAGLDTFALGEPVEVSVVLNDRVHGYNLGYQSTTGGRYSRLIAINPLSLIKGLPKDMQTPHVMASLIWHTLKHEISHDAVGGHNESFTMEETRTSTLAGKFELAAIELLRKAYGKGNQFKPGIAKAFQIYENHFGRGGRARGAVGGQSGSVAGSFEAAGAGTPTALAEPAGGGTGTVQQSPLPPQRAAIPDDRGEYGVADAAFVAAQAEYSRRRKETSTALPQEDTAGKAELERKRGAYDKWLGKALEQKAAEVLPEGGFDPEATLADVWDRLPAEIRDSLSFDSWNERTNGIFTRTELPVESAVVTSRIDKALSSLDDGGAKQPATPDGQKMTPEDKARLRGDLDKFGKFSANFLTLLQIAERNLHIPAVQKYLGLMREWYRTRTEVTSRADATLRLWDKLGKTRANKLSEYLLEVAQASFDKKRKLKPEELIELGRKVGIDEKVMDVYRLIELDFQTILAEMEEAMIKEAEAILHDSPDAATAYAEQIRKEFAMLRNRNYFPFARFGQHVVKVQTTAAFTFQGKKYKEGTYLTVETFERKGPRDKRLAQLKAEFAGKPVNVVTDFLPEKDFAFQGFPPTLFNMLEDKMGFSAEQHKRMRELLLEVSPGHSFLKHMKHRRGVPGYSRDAQRAYAQYFQHAGNHLARLKYRTPLDGAVSELNHSATQLSQAGFDAATRRYMADKFRQHYEYTMNPGNDLASVRAFMFAYYFAFVPKQVLVNMTQIPLLAYPYLAATNGKVMGVSDAIVVRNLVKAMKDTLSAFDGSIMNPGFDKPIKGITLEETKLIQRAVSEGFLNESFASEVAGMANGNILSRMLPGHTFDKLARRTTELGTLPFRVSEEFNRRTTFLAAIRLALQRGDSPEAAFQYARKAIETTMFEYARWNRVAIARGKKSVLFIFKTYLQHALYFYATQPGKGRALLAMAVLGGLQGLPGADDLLEALSSLSTFLKHEMGLKDPWTDLKGDLRELVASIGLDGDTVMNGLARRTFGLHTVGAAFGLPIPALDFSSSIQMGRVVPGLESLSRFALAKTTGTQGPSAPAMAAQLLQEAAGPTASVGMNFLRAMTVNDRDSLAFLKLMMPTALRNMARTYDAYTKGSYVNSNGNPIVNFDPMDAEHQAEIAGQLLGLTPSRVRSAQEMTWAQKEAVQFYEARKEGILTAYAVAVGARDREAIADAREALKRHNRQVPPAARISADMLRESILRRVRNEKIRSLGMPSQARYFRLYQQIQQAYQPNSPRP